MQFSVKALENTDARIAIYDALGRRVAELHNGPMTAGDHRFEWTGNVASGIYFVLAKSGSAEDVRRVVVTR
jgi:flagellar hook assembly protein FlgD